MQKRLGVEHNNLPDQLVHTGDDHRVVNNSAPSRRKKQHMTEGWWRVRESRIEEYQIKLELGGRLFEENKG